MINYDNGLTHYLLRELESNVNGDIIKSEEEAFTVNGVVLDENARLKREIIKLKSVLAYDYGENCSQSEFSILSEKIAILEGKIDELINNNDNLLLLGDGKNKELIEYDKELDKIKECIEEIELLLDITVSYKSTFINVASRLLCEDEIAYKIEKYNKNLEEKYNNEVNYETFINNIKDMDNLARNIIFKYINEGLITKKK